MHKKRHRYLIIFSYLLFSVSFSALSLCAEKDEVSYVAQATCGDIQVVLTPSLGTFDGRVEAWINITNNLCGISSLGFDLFFDTNIFSYLGLDTEGCMTSDWSMIDGYELSSGQIRIGGYAGSGSEIRSSDNGCLIKVRLKIVRQCSSGTDGLQSTVTIESYIDDLETYLPRPAQGILTMVCCEGAVSLPMNLEGTWGNFVRIPVNIANNTNVLCDFEFDFVFDPSVFEFKGTEKTAAIQNWSILTWNQIEPGTVRINGVAGSGGCIAAQSEISLLNLKMSVKCAGYETDTPSLLRIEEYGDGIAGMCPRFFEADFLYQACPRLGDVNGDTNISPADAQAAFEIYLGRITPTTAQLTTADANCGCPCDDIGHKAENFCISPMDAQWIFKHFLGRSLLPLCCADFPCPESSALSFLYAYFPRFEKLRLYPLPSKGIPGELVNIPVIVNNPQGIQEFSFEMIYPQALLEFRGLRSSPLTKAFESICAEEVAPGIIRVDAVGGEKGIQTEIAGSLCVAVFLAKEGMNGRSLLELSNLEGDISEAEIENGYFVVDDRLSDEAKYIELGRKENRDGNLVVPIEVTSAFDIKAFAIVLEYNPEKLGFLGVERTYLTKDFVAVEGNEPELGIVKVGGYGMSGILDMNAGALLKLVFDVKEPGGEIEIVKTDDDLEKYTFIK